ncbi:endonuclease [Nocardioides litoris]|uniref:endonuclease n=1 Tax=Nocardioides litoris TaxID=1926648 RepID=UPI00111D6A13|nr:endonuclease [Nocardioides litoris]
MASTRERLTTLCEEHGTTFAEESGLHLRDQPAPLFQLLVLTSLLSANLDRALGVRAADAVRRAHPTSARLREDGEDAVHETLVEARYLRKRQTARQLVALADEVEDRWDGDLRRLRDDVDGDADALGDRLQDFTGIGAVGADIFRREVQAVWPAIRPYADQRVLDLARAHDLPHTVSGLASATDGAGLGLEVVGAALVRAEKAESD